MSRVSIFIILVLLCFNAYSQRRTVDKLAEDCARHDTILEVNSQMIFPFGKIGFIKVIPEQLEFNSPKEEVIEFQESLAATDENRYLESSHIKKFHKSRKNTLTREKKPTFSPGISSSRFFSVSKFVTDEEDLISPLDNSSAINLGGDLLVASNQSVTLIESKGDKHQRTLYDFFSGKVAIPMDPNVVYDKESNRFVMVCIDAKESKADSKCHVYIAVSNPKSPLLDWKLHVIESPNVSFFDYPRVALTSDNLLITGSVYEKSSKTAEAAVMSFMIEEVRAGQIMECLYYCRFKDRVGYLCPVEVMQNDVKGSNLLVSNFWRNGSLSFFLYQINVKDRTKISRHHFLRDKYPIAHFPVGIQKNGDEVNNFDLRIVQAVLKDGQIYFVFVNGDQGSLRSRIILVKYSIKDNKCSSIQIGNEGQTYYCYPSFTFVKDPNGTEKVVVLYQGVSNESFSKSYLTTCDLNLRSSVEIFISSSSADLKMSQGDTLCRLGDYTSICSDFNKPIVYVSTSAMNTDPISKKSYLSSVHLKLSTTQDDKFSSLNTEEQTLTLMLPLEDFNQFSRIDTLGLKESYVKINSPSFNLLVPSWSEDSTIIYNANELNFSLDSLKRIGYQF